MTWGTWVQMYPFLSTASTPALGPTQSPIQWILGAISPRLKRPGREADHSPHLVLWSTMVELYLHSRIRLHCVMIINLIREQLYLYIARFFSSLVIIHQSKVHSRRDLELWSMTSYLLLSYGNFHSHYNMASQCTVMRRQIKHIIYNIIISFCWEVKMFL
jgi:hypothetical protein